MNANEFIEAIASVVAKKLQEDKKPISVEQLMTNFAKGQIKVKKEANKLPELDEPEFNNIRDKTLWHWTQIPHTIYNADRTKSWTIGGYKLVKDGITEKREYTNAKGVTKVKTYEKVILEKNGQQIERLVTNGGFKLSPIFGTLIVA